ncbi:hypothetical protein ACLOJK_039587, partial [Asimina triloba]
VINCWKIEHIYMASSVANLLMKTSAAAYTSVQDMVRGMLVIFASVENSVSFDDDGMIGSVQPNRASSTTAKRPRAVGPGQGGKTPVKPRPRSLDSLA